MKACGEDNMRLYLAAFLLILCGCGVNMEDVKKELMPGIQKNAEIIDSIKKSQDQSFTKISDSVLYMEKDISKIRDRIKSLQLFVEREIAEQNEYLAEFSDIQFEALEKETKYLNVRLKELKKLMDIVEIRKSKTNKQVNNVEVSKKAKPVQKAESNPAIKDASKETPVNK